LFFLDFHVSITQNSWLHFCTTFEPF